MLDKRAIDRISGAAWDEIRPTFTAVHDALVSVSPEVRGELTTIYIKYLSKETGDQPFAVLWVKKRTELLLGLAMPPGFSVPNAIPAPVKYAGLTVYLRFEPGSEVPASLASFAKVAYYHRIPA